MPWNVRLLRWVLRLGARLPLRVLQAVGAALGPLAHWLGAREYRVAKKNVELCFPGLDAADRARFVDRSLSHTGRGLAELAWLWGGDPARALSTIRAVHGRAHLDAALAGGRGVLLAAPHLGQWELLNLWLSTVAPLTILYRVPQRAEYEPLLVGARGALGAEAVRAEAAGVRLLFRRLKEGRLVGILPDQRPKGGEGVEAPFFGRPAMTMTLLCRMAHKSGAAVVFGFAERLPRGEGFALHFLPAEPAVADGDPATAVAAMNRGIEACVRLAPEQYQWTYKRFSFRGDGDDGPDPVYGKWKRSRHAGKPAGG
ncbi:MAG: lipid A biosynthesis acyltransferase [Xanthomonadaceae bacterium]|jgi:KDO2-lipid IV(A) lauroyltransferase|nr:lipid A biosynthesis acyltransferase [Xanthomonadaceae bacterium]